MNTDIDSDQRGIRCMPGLDMYDMRGALAQAGLTYID